MERILNKLENELSGMDIGDQIYFGVLEIMMEDYEDDRDSHDRSSAAIVSVTRKNGESEWFARYETNATGTGWESVDEGKTIKEWFLCWDELPEIWMTELVK